MGLKNYVVKYVGAIPPSLCDEILNEYADSSDWVDAEMGGIYMPDARRCSVINLSNTEVIARGGSSRAKIDGDLFGYVSELGRRYRQSHPMASFNFDSGYTLIRYEKGDYFRLHADAGSDEQRVVSCSIQLNDRDEFSGGGWSFFSGGDLKLTQGKGDAVMFPSNFCFPHEIEEVKSGVRYAIVTWLTYKPVGGEG